MWRCCDNEDDPDDDDNDNNGDDDDNDVDDDDGDDDIWPRRGSTQRGEVGRIGIPQKWGKPSNCHQNINIYIEQHRNDENL